MRMDPEVFLSRAVPRRVPRDVPVVTIAFDESRVATNNEASAALLRLEIEEYVQRWRRGEDVDFPYEGVFAAFVLGPGEHAKLHPNIDRYVEETHRVTPLRVSYRIYEPACVDEGTPSAPSLLGVGNAFVVHIVDVDYKHS